MSLDRINKEKKRQKIIRYLKSVSITLEKNINLEADGGCLGILRRRRTWRGCDKPRGGA